MAYDLLQCASNHPFKVGVSGALEALLDDDDRYVSGYAKVIVVRIGSKIIK